MYLDLVVALNFAVDLLLILGTNRLAGFPPGISRAAAAAALGAVYAGTCLLPGFSFLGHICWRLVCLGLMGLIAFGMNPSAWKRSGIFALLSMAMGGVALSMGRSEFPVVILSAAANFLIAMQDVTSVVLLAVIWGANGFFQSMGWTPGLAVLAKWWPGKKRGFATGFANAFSGFGQVAASCAVIAAYAWAPQWGWKAAFIVPPLFSLVILLAYVVLVKPTPAQAGLPDYREEDSRKTEEELPEADKRRLSWKG